MVAMETPMTRRRDGMEDTFGVATTDPTALNADLGADLVAAVDGEVVVGGDYREVRGERRREEKEVNHGRRSSRSIFFCASTTPKWGKTPRR